MIIVTIIYNVNKIGYQSIKFKKFLIILDNMETLCYSVIRNNN